jgi:hypothetical protein
MELLQKLQPFDKRNLSSFLDVRSMFNYACRHVSLFRAEEFKETWGGIKNLVGESIEEVDFMVEYCFCVYVSGFRATTVAKKYDDLLRVNNILDENDYYVPITKDNIVTDLSSILEVFNNPKKAHAIQAVRKLILKDGWESFNSNYVKDKNPLELQNLPYLGPALSCHLARNLGNVDIVKPDVHLNRLSGIYGFESPQKMCEFLASPPSIPPAYIDLVLWMASVDNGTASEISD